MKILRTILFLLTLIPLQGHSSMNFSFTPQDVDQLTKTVLGEALGEDDNGKIAVMNVVLNRLNSKRFNRSGKKSITDIVRKPFAFSAWNDPDKGGNNLVKKGPGDKDYEYTKSLVLDFLKGNYADNTGGATHYRVSSLATPAYYDQNEYKDADKNFLKIGKHTFMSTPVDGADRADYTPSSSSARLDFPLFQAKYRDKQTPAEMLMQGSDMSEDSLQNLANVLEQRKKKEQGFFARILGNAISGKGIGSLF